MTPSPTSNAIERHCEREHLTPTQLFSATFLAVLTGFLSHSLWIGSLWFFFLITNYRVLNLYDDK